MRLFWKPETYARFWGITWGWGVVAIGAWPVVWQLRSGGHGKRLEDVLREVRANRSE